MATDFIIKDIDNTKGIKDLRKFIYSQPFWYPKYDQWVDGVCIPEIEKSYKKGIIAYCNGYVVGNVIYQQHKSLPKTREIKNLRIHPELRRRDLGHFLLRQVEEEQKEQFDRIIIDTNTKRKDMISFLNWCGYNILYKDFLYDKENIDVVLIKEFNKNKDLAISNVAQNPSIGSKRY
jgi:GNAT superfamily N-acetyltransferase